MSKDASDFLESADAARREGRLDDAHRCYREAVDLSGAPGSEQCLIRGLAGLGQVERDRNNLRAAQGHYEQALLLCRRHADALLTAHTARHLGDIYRANGLAVQAESVLDDAIALYRGDPGTRPLDLANAIRPLALLKSASGDIDGARSLWHEALVLYANAAVSEGVAECAARLLDIDEQRPP